MMIWLIMAGRGWGKTRTGAEWLAEEAERAPETEWAVVAPTYGDVRDKCVQGPSGLLKALGLTLTSKEYNKSLGEIRLPNKSVIHMLSAEVIDQARGFNLSGVWCDELAAWRYPATWYEGLVPALRVGAARAVITTTPRMNALLQDIAGREDGTVVVTRGSTFDNAANLSPLALVELKRRYEGTRLGRQELYGELLTEVVGALWRLPMIEQDRYKVDEQHSVSDVTDGLVRIVVAIDPAVTSGEDADETGIVVVGKDADEEYWVLDDASGIYTPDEWATIALHLLDTWKADRIVGETNNGGDMIETILRGKNRSVPFRKVWASRGKRVRAEPVSALYEQHRVHHVGVFAELETQMCTWVPDMRNMKSPDRMDALVWAIKELEGPTGLNRISNPGAMQGHQLGPHGVTSQTIRKDYTRLGGNR